MKRTLKSISKNGRQFNLLSLPGSNYFRFEIVNTFGSNIESLYHKHTSKNIYGLSHLVEHLGFKSTRDYTSEELNSIIKTKGMYNASTNTNEINYWFKTSMNNIDLAISVVCNYAFNDLCKITQDEFDKEKKVVINEIKKYNDDHQVMFSFNTHTKLFNLHEDDNIFGNIDNISEFTLNDAIELKNIFNSNSDIYFNITYDPQVLLQKEILDKITSQINTWNIITADFNEYTPTKYKKYINEMQLITGEKYLQNNSEQMLVSINIPISSIYSTIPLKAALNYFEDISETSLNEYIREKNGLTYSVSLYSWCNGDNAIVTFTCDVSEGTQELMIDLFKQSIQDTVSNFDEDKYKNLIDTKQLSNTMKKLSQEYYNSLFNLIIYHNDIFEKYKNVLSNDADKYFNNIYTEICSFEEVKSCMNEVLNSVITKNYTLVKNYE